MQSANFFLSLNGLICITLTQTITHFTLYKNGNDMKQAVQIRCKNNKKTEKVAIGSTLSDIFSQFNLPMPYGPICAKVNNKVEGMQ